MANDIVVVVIFEGCSRLSLYDDLCPELIFNTKAQTLGTMNKDAMPMRVYRVPFSLPKACLEGIVMMAG